MWSRQWWVKRLWMLARLFGTLWSFPWQLRNSWLKADKYKKGSFLLPNSCQVCRMYHAIWRSVVYFRPFTKEYRNMKQYKGDGLFSAQQWPIISSCMGCYSLYSTCGSAAPCCLCACICSQCMQLCNSWDMHAYNVQYFLSDIQLQLTIAFVIHYFFCKRSNIITNNYFR